MNSPPDEASATEGWPGHCWACGEPTHEIQKRYPTGHALAGEPMAVGRPLADVRRATVVLSDGSTADLTLHAGCLAAADAVDLKTIWNRVLARHARETTGPEPARMAAIVPFGILYHAAA